MTAPPEDPGASAVYLSFDEDDSDQYNVHTITVRLKVLTQAGVERYSDVQVGVQERHFAIGDVQAQTVHSDGRVIPFTGKPFVKTIRHRGETYKATVFSMPDVQVGSILEYRYRLAYDDNLVLPAHWYIQQNAFVMHAHFTFHPLDLSGSHYVLLDHGQTSHGLFWTTMLPNDAKLTPSNGSGHNFYELTADNLPALPDEDALPPMSALGYRVLFYYAAQTDTKSYWNNEGKFLSKDMNAFATAGPKLRSDVAGLLLPADSDESKARKLYAAAMKMENTDLTREHTRQEDSAEGLRTAKTAEDIWERQRGASDEIALTYLAMLRAGGIHAYGMKVTNRDHNVFQPSFIDTSQLNDILVIANIAGKDVFLDPGTRFCPYGQLAWRHSWASGIRQTENGSAIAEAAPLSYKDSLVQRVAKLGLEEDGIAGGTLILRWTGQGALELRQREIGEAAADTKQRLEEQAQAMLPGGMHVHVITIENLEDGEKPLEVVFGVRGPIGTGHGHRLLITQSLLRSDEGERFTSATRKNDVYFHYPYTAVDMVEMELAPNFKLEGMPPEKKNQALGLMAYALHTSVNGNKVQMVRSVSMAGVIISAADYGKMREFFGGLRAADEDQLLLVNQGTTTAATEAPEHAAGK